MNKVWLIIPFICLTLKPQEITREDLVKKLPEDLQKYHYDLEDLELINELPVILQRISIMLPQEIKLKIAKELLSRDVWGALYILDKKNKLIDSDHDAVKDGLKRWYAILPNDLKQTKFIRAFFILNKLKDAAQDTIHQILCNEIHLPASKIIILNKFARDMYEINHDLKSSFVLDNTAWLKKQKGVATALPKPANLIIPPTIKSAFKAAGAAGIFVGQAVVKGGNCFEHYLIDGDNIIDANNNVVSMYSKISIPLHDDHKFLYIYDISFFTNKELLLSHFPLFLYNSNVHLNGKAKQFYFKSLINLASELRTSKSQIDNREQKFFDLLGAQLKKMQPNQLQILWQQ